MKTIVTQVLKTRVVQAVKNKFNVDLNVENIEEIWFWVAHVVVYTNDAKKKYTLKASDVFLIS